MAQRSDCGCPPRFCLICGAHEPCMTEADLKPTDPGIPCTWDTTYAELVQKVKALQREMARLERLVQV